MGRHAGRLVGLDLLLVAAAAVLLPAWPGTAAPLGPTGMAAVVLVAALFALTEQFVVHFEFREHAYTVSLNELPMVIGLLLCGPVSLLAARVLGGVAVLGATQRQPARKLGANAALFALEAAITGAVFRGVLTLLGGTAPRLLWVAAFTATQVAVVVGSLVVSVAMRLAGADVQPRDLARVTLLGALAAFATTGLALTAVTLYRTDPAAIVLVLAMAAIPLAAYRGYASLRQRYHGLQQVYEFTRVLSGSPELQGAVRTTLNQARRLLRTESAELLLLEHDDDDAPVRINVSADGSLLTRREPGQRDPVWQRLTDGTTGLVIPRGTRDASLRPLLTSRDAIDLLAAPLRQGAAVVGTDRLGAVSTFVDEDLKVLATLANHAGVSIENARLVDRLRAEITDREHQALHDALTGLGNRSLFAQRTVDALRLARSGDWGVAVLLLDLNRFKDVNDTLGHLAGDRLLQEVARRVATALPSTTTVARLGGDEFAVLIPHVTCEDQAVAAAEAVRAALDVPLPLDGLDLTVTASIGIALSPSHGEDAATLLQHADIAMYAAKESGAGVSLYSPERDARSTRRLALAGELREAIRARALSVCYQPKASLTDGTITGVEALARWDHPDHGPIPPDEFIPLAEHVGLIGALTEHVLVLALDQLSAWHRSGLDIQVAVNLSVHSLLDLNLPAQVRALLDDAGVAPDRLILEVTESQIMSDPERTLRVLGDLDALGVRLAIDDFGTGYSSLSYLKRLPVHEVKIDKSFVRNMATDDSDVTIVRSVIELSRSLGMCVVAEGVEDQMSWDLLAALGCDTAQGYYLSRPVPAARLTPWLRQRRAAVPAVGSRPRRRVPVASRQPEAALPQVS